MIKNIAAAAALAFTSALITCSPAQAAAPQSGSAYPWPPYDYVLLASAPLWPAPVLVRPTDQAWFAYAPLTGDVRR
ncbi:hypothetical protein [Streptomyces sp. NPDC096339]|uniref:hypothetical protein n=1 Tax=Streptomyces sp. NPDC096339 TaxID=3366086 RepID=UPI00381D5406